MPPPPAVPIPKPIDPSTGRPWVPPPSSVPRKPFEGVVSNTWNGAGYSKGQKKYTKVA